MSYLVDTNVISEIRKGERAHPAVARWYASIEGTDLYLSTLVLGELRKGVEAARPRDARKAEALEHWLQQISRVFQGHIIGVDEAIADEWGRISCRRSIPAIDGLLAATAKVHGLVLVTRNVTHVSGLGIDLLDPFSEGSPPLTPRA